MAAINRFLGTAAAGLLSAALLPFAVQGQTPPSTPPALLTPAPADAPDGNYGPYLTYAEMQAKIAGWAKDYPNLVQVSSLGKTFEGRDIPLLRLSASAAETAPEVLLLSGIHPREQQPQMGVARLVDELLGGFGKDPVLTRLLQDRVLWIVPVFNVDGKVYDMRHGNGTTRGADWRKNRHPNLDGTVGVDLNRNWGVRWGGNRALDPTWQTTTDTPSGNIYEGLAPLSEPEDRALAAFIVSRKGHLRAFLDLHSPLHAVYTPSYLIGPECVRYQTLVKAMQARQTNPYPTLPARLTPDTEPSPGGRGGDSGITYTWVYYTQGVYALNLEYAPPKEAKTGVRARYAPPAEIDDEYLHNIRGPLLQFFQSAGDLPVAHAGSATVAAGFGTFDKPLTPGASVSWTPPAISGPWAYAVLVSEGGEIGVASEYRRAPLSRGFTILVDSHAKLGATVPLTLYLWDAERGVSTAHFTFAVAP